jgi:hypothetical protein
MVRRAFSLSLPFYTYRGIMLHSFFPPVSPRRPKEGIMKCTLCHGTRILAGCDDQGQTRPCPLCARNQGPGLFIGIPTGDNTSLPRHQPDETDDQTPQAA